MERQRSYRWHMTWYVGIALLVSFFNVLWMLPTPAQAATNLPLQQRRITPRPPQATQCTVQNTEVTVLDDWQQTDPNVVTTNCNNTVAIGMAPIASAVDVAVCKADGSACQIRTINLNDNSYAYFLNAPELFIFRWKLHDPKAPAFGSLMTIYF